MLNMEEEANFCTAFFFAGEQQTMMQPLFISEPYSDICSSKNEVK